VFRLGDSRSVGRQLSLSAAFLVEAFLPEKYINCLSFCSAVCSDMLLILRSEVAGGHYAVRWTQRAERWPPDAEMLRDSVAEALTRIDFAAVDRIVEDWVRDENPGFVERIVGTERFMYRTGVILALVFFHAYFANCEMTMMGCSIRIGLQRKAPVQAS